MVHLFKSLLPAKLRQGLRFGFVRFKDFVSGTRFKMVSSSDTSGREGRSFQERITIIQPINKTKHSGNKIHNLHLAISRFQDVSINPGWIFSFWHMVGPPTERFGFVSGINIIDGRLDFDIGGGLCQLSGLLYHLAIAAGLDIVLRYPHSVDLYTDETRYTPLGADATVAYGYKDLRIKNSLKFPLCFRVRVEEYRLIGAVCAPEEIENCRIEFVREDLEDRKIVRTERHSSRGSEILATSVYVNATHKEDI